MTVYPTLVPNTHVLASVNHVFNAIYVRGDVVGDTLYYGRGAGQDATASAVLSDLADAALDLKCGSKSRVPPFVPHEREGAVLKIDDVVSRYYLRLSVVDRPGTLARIATILGEIENRHFVGDSTGRPRRRECAADFDDARCAERRDETRFEQDREIAGGESAAGHDPC